MSGDDPKLPKLADVDKLELADRPAPPNTYEPPEPYRTTSTVSRRSAWPWVVLLLVLAAIAALRLQRVRDQLMSINVLPSRGLKPMVVMSAPSGAKLIIDGTTVGETPWAGDNNWHGAGVPYELSADGFVTLKGTFEGDRELTLNVTLKRR